MDATLGGPTDGRDPGRHPTVVLRCERRRRTVVSMDTSVALVAGSSRGLGLLVARELLDRGHRVAVCARDEAEVQRAAQMLSPHGTAYPYVCDVSSREQVDALVARVQQDLGPVDVLVTVAGVIQVGPAESMTHEHFAEAIGTMLWGPVHLAQAVLPGMRSRRRGHIGTVASIGGSVAPPHLLPYATAKFGAVGFSEGLTAELAGTGVTATTVIPGLMRTGSHENATFTGDHGAEYAWFAPGASLPLVSMDAERAARRIVSGVLAGRTHVILTPLATVGVRVHGVAPATTVKLLGVVNRLLPGAPAQPRSETIPGHQAKGRLAARSELGARAVETLTTWGTKSAKRFNERFSQR